MINQLVSWQPPFVTTNLSWLQPASPRGNFFGSNHLQGFASQPKRSNSMSSSSSSSTTCGFQVKHRWPSHSSISLNWLALMTFIIQSLGLDVDSMLIAFWSIAQMNWNIHLVSGHDSIEAVAIPFAEMELSSYPKFTLKQREMLRKNRSLNHQSWG